MRLPQVRLVGLRSVGPGGSPIVPLPEAVTEPRVLQSLLGILDRTPLCSLATIAPNRTAHSCHVYFAPSPELHLYFLSDPNSGHCRHVKANPTMAVSVYDSTQTWGGSDRGIALWGTCRETRAKGSQRAEDTYGQRFTAYRKWRLGLRPDDEATIWRFYRFVPTRVKVFDETRFGPAVFVEASVKRVSQTRSS
jgi:uncharacterized protein YhbP (UPF0306 family)